MSELVYTRQYSPTPFVARIINIVIGLIELLLAGRLILEFFGANAGSSFVSWVYGASEGLVSPFFSAFPSIANGNGSFVDLSTVLAMIAYAVLGWLVIRLSSLIFSTI